MQRPLKLWSKEGRLHPKVAAGLDIIHMVLVLQVCKFHEWRGS